MRPATWQEVLAIAHKQSPELGTALVFALFLVFWVAWVCSWQRGEASNG